VGEWESGRVEEWKDGGEDRLILISIVSLVRGYERFKLILVPVIVLIIKPTV
jgi:hypothetical protein